MSLAAKRWLNHYDDETILLSKAATITATMCCKGSYCVEIMTGWILTQVIYQIRKRPIPQHCIHSYANCGSYALSFCNAALVDFALDVSTHE